MAWAPRTWVVGEIVTGAHMNEEIKNQFNNRAARQAVQGADLTITNSITPVDTDMAFTAQPGEIYAYWAYIAYSATINSDFCWVWSVPSGTVMHRNIVGFDPANTAAGVGTGGSILMRRPSPGTQVVIGGKSATSPPGDHRSALDMGTITMGATGGTIRMLVTQGTSHADQTILRALSTVLYQRIA